MQDKRVTAFAEGYDDAYTRAEYLNTYDQEDQPDEWNAYEEGYTQGLNQFLAEAE